MSRLLHAAARGARVQSLYFKLRDNPSNWENTTGIPTDYNHYYDYRIHPDDAHLQYGPISTMLRDIAITGDCTIDAVPYIRVHIEREIGYWDSTEEHRKMFCLILAEALADEGM